jgi:hypothetical protein
MMKTGNMRGIRSRERQEQIHAEFLTETLRGKYHVIDLEAKERIVSERISRK